MDNHIYNNTVMIVNAQVNLAVMASIPPSLASDQWGRVDSPINNKFYIIHDKQQKFHNNKWVAPAIAGSKSITYSQKFYNFSKQNYSESTILRVGLAHYCNQIIVKLLFYLNQSFQPFAYFHLKISIPCGIGQYTSNPAGYFCRMYILT